MFSCLGRALYLDGDEAKFELPSTWEQLLVVYIMQSHSIIFVSDHILPDRQPDGQLVM
jgi:hypothetical protein